MKKSVKLLAIMMALLMTLAMGLSACGKSSEEAADDGQNPVMNFVGNYSCDRASIFISAEGEENGASAIVTWGSSAWESSSWMMSGTFDAETLRFEYHDCVRTDYVYNEDGEATSQTEVYTGGHGFMFFSDGDPITLTWQDDQEHIADGMVFEYTDVIPENGGESEEVGMPNPWSDVGSVEMAAAGAGFDNFSASEGVEISLGEVKGGAYRYMDGLAEVIVDFPAVEMTIRKGSRELEMAEGDISGDYGEYKYDWKTDVNGTEVWCFGNREGEATKTIWNDGTYDYSITVLGLGGDTDYGLPEEDVITLVSGIK